MIAALWSWWRREMAALLPGFLAELGGPSAVLTATPARAGSDLRLALTGRGGGALGPLRSLPDRQRRRLQRAHRAGRLRIDLALAPEQVLRRTVALPLAAAGDVAEALSYEIDRITPFAPDEIYFAAAAERAVPKADRLDVDLVFVPRGAADPALSALAEAGLPADRLTVAGTGTGTGTASAAAEGDAAGVPTDAAKGPNLLPRAPRGWTPGQRLTAGLAVLAVLFGGLWLWQSWQARTERVDALRQQVAAERRAAIAAQESRLADAAGQGLAAAAYARRSAAPLTVAVIRDATALMPDGTWIERLTYDGETLELFGLSAQATRLIGLFDSHPGFRNPTFRTPVTRSPGAAAERFLLTVEIVPPAGAGARQ